jgi:hypothetical protein
MAFETMYFEYTVNTVLQNSKDDMKYNSQSHSMDVFLDFTAPQLSIPQIASSPLCTHTEMVTLFANICTLLQ